MAKQVYNRDKLGRFTSSAKAVKNTKKSVKKSGTKSSKKKVEFQQDYILLDGSGSMGKLWDEALGAVNSYVTKLALDKVDTEVTLVVFDSTKFSVVRNEEKPSNWKEVTSTEIKVGAMTPLNDAVGRIVSKAQNANPDKAAIIIMTDGLENASKELNKQQAKNLLDECRAKGWQVIFLGADFDNATQAADYGNAVAATATVAPKKLKKSMEFAGQARVLYSATGANMSYSDAQKRFLSE